jgi:uncharacterized protein YecT (DUF1311 family)
LSKKKNKHWVGCIFTECISSQNFCPTRRSSGTRPEAGEPLNFTLGIMKNLFSLLVVLFTSAVALAATNEAPDEAVVKEMASQIHMPEEEIRENYNACNSSHNLKVIICLRYNWVAEDIRLNRIYKQARAEAKKIEQARADGIEYEASLVKAQRAWIVFRDALCKFEGQLRAGTGREAGMDMLACMKEATKQRADYLEAHLNTENE